jgi:hypothetical protein
MNLGLSIEWHVEHLLPPGYRIPFHKDWLTSQLWPLQVLHEDFVSLRATDVSESSFPNHAFALQLRLQQQVNAGIEIEWNRRNEAFYLYDELSGKPHGHLDNSVMGSVVIFDAAALSESYNFTVKHPINAQIDFTRLRAIVGAHLHPGFTYKLSGYII